LGEGDTPPTVNLDIFMETLTYHPVAIDLWHFVNNMDGILLDSAFIPM
jgi:hypothetical protein